MLRLNEGRLCHDTATLHAHKHMRMDTYLTRLPSKAKNPDGKWTKKPTIIHLGETRLEIFAYFVFKHIIFAQSAV